MGKEDISQFEKEYTVNDEVYGIAYLDAYLKDLFGGSLYSKNTFRLLVTIDGGEENTIEYDYSYSELEDGGDTYIRLNILPDPKKMHRF